MPDTLNLNKAAAAAALGPAGRRAHRAVLTAFLDTGRPPTRNQLEQFAGPAALAELAERDLVAYDDTGEVRAAYPFSPYRTRHRVTWQGGPEAYAMCAIDALGVSAMLGRPVTVTATPPDDGPVVVIEVAGDQAAWTPESAVVHAAAKGEDCCVPSVDRTCGHINVFASAEAARAWSAAHPGLTGSILDLPEALRHGVAEFGDMLAG